VARIVGGRGDSSAVVSLAACFFIDGYGCIPPQVLAYWMAEVLAFSSTFLSAIIDAAVSYTSFDRDCDIVRQPYNVRRAQYPSAVCFGALSMAEECYL